VLSHALYCYADCNAKCQYADYYAESVSMLSDDKCHYAQCHYAQCHYTQCHYAQCHYDEFHYDEFHYADCFAEYHFADLSF
jgi:hypothetical protein